MRSRVVVAALAGASLVLSTMAQAQAPPRSVPPAAGERDPMSPREVQRLFDAYVVVQSQEALALRDDQYPQFLPRLRALQDARRRHQQGRNQILAELNRLTAPRTSSVDETAIAERLRALDELDARSAADIRKAYEGLDQVLDVRQRARLRLFEERVERQKLELLMRARRAAGPRQNRPQQKPQR
jgi:hypothetical protein